MLAYLWGVAWGAGAFACLCAGCGRILRGDPAALIPMAANLALIGGCLALCALFFPAKLALAGAGLAGALVLGGLFQARGRLPASKRKEDIYD